MLQSMAVELAKRGHYVSIYALPFRRASSKGISVRGYRYLETLTSRIDCDVAYHVFAPLLDRLFRTDAPRIAGIHNFALWPEFALERVRAAELAYRVGPYASAVLMYNRLLRGRDITARFDAVHIPNMLSPAIFNIPMYCIPNWYDDEVFRPRGSKSDNFTVLYVGSEAWTKGFDVFLRVCEILSKRARDIRFIAVGTDKEVKGENVYVYPFVNSQRMLARLYSMSHMTIIPSRADIFGITLIESMACGTPVLTSDLMSHRCFLPKFSLCSSISDYVRKTIKVYKSFKAANGTYELLVRDTLRFSSLFSKKRLFPLFEKMIYEVSRKS